MLSKLLKKTLTSKLPQFQTLSSYTDCHRKNIFFSSVHLHYHGCFFYMALIKNNFSKISIKNGLSWVYRHVNI